MADTERGIIAWFARNSVAANLLMFCLLIGGLVSVFTIKKEIFPRMDLKLISIQAVYPGAAPQEVEEGLTIKIEEAIQNVDGIKKIRSTSQEGISSISIEIHDHYDVANVLDEIKLRIDAIPSFPEQAEKINIYQIKPEQDVIWLQVYGDVSEKVMKEIAKDIRDELIALPAVSKSEVIGARDYELSITVSEAKLREYNLSFNDIVTAVRNSSLDIPGGTIKTESGDILLRAKGQAYRGHEFENLTLLTRPDGTRLLLKEVAEIHDDFEEREGYARFNQKPSISIQVTSLGEKSALEVVKQVKEYVTKKKATLPEGVYLDHWADSSYYLQGRIDLMVKNMWFGACLVFLILAMFLRLRLAFWVIIGIPVCFLGTMLLMPTTFFDLSINMVTLFGFILVLGIVVDDAIIIGENVYSEIESNGHSVDNVIRGAQRVAMPATFGVLTTIAAFLPMLAMSGTSAPIWESIAIIVILCLGFSLLESKLILPAHLVHMKIVDPNPATHNYLQRLQDFFSNGLKNFTHNHYSPFLEKCLNQRYTTLAAFLAAIILTIGLIGGGVVRWVFFPDLPSDYISVNLTMVEGTPAHITNKVLGELESALYRVDQEYKEKTGESIVKHTFSYSDSPTQGQIWVEMLKGEERNIDGSDITNQWRERTGSIPGIKSILFRSSTSGGSASDIAFQLNGKDLNKLGNATRELRQKLASYSGIFDIRDTLSDGKQEIILHIKPEAEAMGITLSDLARQVRQGFYGAEAQRIQRDGEEVKVMVRYPLSERRSIGHLENMRIRMPDNREIPFASIADLQTSDGYGTITRIDGIRSVTVEANVDKANVEPSKIAKEIQEHYMPELAKRYPGITYGLEGASNEEQQSQVDLLKGAFFALFAIYVLMAIPLRSYIQPLIIMSVIPFGVIGAIIGHLIFNMPISVLSLCGIIALSGVVVNDSLIMVDFVNQARLEGKTLREAAKNAGTQRFRAILLTSLTTFFGLLPIVLERSLQAKIIMPMAISLAFGILFSTIITLLLIPCLYLILHDIKQLLGKLWQWMVGSRPKETLPPTPSLPEH